MLESESVPCVVCTVLCLVPARYRVPSEETRQRPASLLFLEEVPHGTEGL